MGSLFPENRLQWNGDLADTDLLCVQIRQSQGMRSWLYQYDVGVPVLPGIYLYLFL